MNIPEIQSYEEMAINTVLMTINKAQEKLGLRQNLFQIALGRNKFAVQLLSLKPVRPPLAITTEKFLKEAIERKWRLIEALAYIIRYHGTSQDECSQYYYFELSLKPVRPPLAITTEKFLKEAIERKWRLIEALAYIIRYHGTSQDECSQYYYFEAIFSQPTVEYPVPQTTVSVFFRVEDKHIDPPDQKGVPRITFRIEGQHTDHDIRYTMLTVDWVLAVMKMKINFFSRLEELALF